MPGGQSCRAQLPTGIAPYFNLQEIDQYPASANRCPAIPASDSEEIGTALMPGATIIRHDGSIVSIGMRRNALNPRVLPSGRAYWRPTIICVTPCAGLASPGQSPAAAAD